jgi:outer membrane protein OmpA-like peptidoglycan-associated protein
MTSVLPRLRILAICMAASAVSAGAALAQVAVPGFYVGGNAGAVLEPSEQLKGGKINTTVHHNPGLALMGALGFRFDYGLRTEEEIGYRRSTIDKLSGAAGTGHSSALSFMTNMLYDFKTGGPLTPYIGVGVGGARTSYNGAGPIAGGTINDSDVPFAYQGIVGVAYNVSDRFALTADYRYFATLESSYKTSTGPIVKGSTASHTVMMGFRWTFDPTVEEAAAPAAPAAAAAAAPAPPAAAQPQPQSFVVFFAFDSAMIDDSGRKVIAQAAAQMKQNQVTRIQVVGHADRAGPEQYNFRLSLRRANAVKAELIRLGINADQVSVEGKGMSQPAVPTPIGVREPRNRRVEITF